MRGSGLKGMSVTDEQQDLVESLAVAAADAVRACRGAIEAGVADRTVVFVELGLVQGHGVTRLLRSLADVATGGRESGETAA
jgi:hypothetical protein